MKHPFFYSSTLWEITYCADVNQRNATPLPCMACAKPSKDKYIFKRGPNPGTSIQKSYLGHHDDLLWWFLKISSECVKTVVSYVLPCGTIQLFWVCSTKLGLSGRSIKKLLGFVTSRKLTFNWISSVPSNPLSGNGYNTPPLKPFPITVWFFKKPMYGFLLGKGLEKHATWHVCLMNVMVSFLTNWPIEFSGSRRSQKNAVNRQWALSIHCRCTVGVSIQYFIQSGGNRNARKAADT